MNKKLEARIARLEKLCNEALGTIKKGSRVSPVGDNESPAIVIDKGTLKRMNDKYHDSLSAVNANEFKYELENEPSMPVVVIQFDGDKDYCIFPEDEVEVYQNYFLTNIKEILSEVLEQMQDCDHEAKGYDDPRNKDRKKELIQGVKDVIASIKTLDKLCDELNK